LYGMHRVHFGQPLFLSCRHFFVQVFISENIKNSTAEAQEAIFVNKNIS
jgi:hypothetical protein